MFYLSDYRSISNQIKPIITNIDKNVFTLTITNENNRINSENEILRAAKPLIYVVSLFGQQTVRFFKNEASKVKAVLKLYSLLLIAAIISLAVLLPPISWSDTRDDPPLNILTKTYVCLQVIEVVYSICIISIWNNGTYVELFKKLNNVDEHYGIGKKVFLKRRFTVILLIFLPTLQVSLTSWLRKFHINNLMTQLTFTILVLQGMFCIYILLNMYLHLLILNSILINKITKMPFGRKFIFQDLLFNKLVKKIFLNNHQMHKNYCWYEIMKIYDKISDCFSLFNQIYSEQVLIMFNTWLLSTILAICRVISPTIKYSQVYKSDILRYSSISFRPLMLVKFSEIFIQERKKTMMIILHIMAHEDLDADYFKQVQTMADLVRTKKLEISANVFTVHIPIVLNFAGRAISYIVLMIQYFYMHVVTSS
ncbi:unnamed protein product [Parnassius mnemosyne]|uniref:Gustatory receptor n=2 Tax=Parnassius mnemosyne TaxID=213953 RepID=A0AAV1K8Y6_9NEOP